MMRAAITQKPPAAEYITATIFWSFADVSLIMLDAKTKFTLAPSPSSSKSPSETVIGSTPGLTRTRIEERLFAISSFFSGEAISPSFLAASIVMKMDESNPMPVAARRPTILNFCP